MNLVVVKIQDGDRRLDFVCETELEVWRAKTIMLKEPGTIAWLRTLTPEDVFLDIGANIGLYSIFAAELGARVVAIEPHLGNAKSLLRNCLRNRSTPPIQVLPIPLSDRSEWGSFHYQSEQAGSSGSQLDSVVGESGDIFTPVAHVVMYTTTVDALVKDQVILQPTRVKIDVDGREWEILQGMPWTLLGVQSLQVEMDPSKPHRHTQEIIELLEDQFRIAQRHYTMAGQQRIEVGEDPLQIPHNVIFERS